MPQNRDHSLLPLKHGPLSSCVETIFAKGHGDILWIAWKICRCSISNGYHASSWKCVMQFSSQTWHLGKNVLGNKSPSSIDWLNLAYKQIRCGSRWHKRLSPLQWRHLKLVETLPFHDAKMANQLNWRLINPTPTSVQWNSKYSNFAIKDHDIHRYEFTKHNKYT